MTEIYSNDFLKIIEDKNNIFKIFFTFSQPALIRSLIKTKIITGGTLTDDYKSLKFKAVTVKTLKQFQKEINVTRGTMKLTIVETSMLIANLSKQLKYLLTKENTGLLGYSPENIVVIDDANFVFLGSDVLTEMEDKKSLVSFPFTVTDFFVSPELLKVTAIPSYINYKTAYFSLACLAVYALLSDDEFYVEYLKNHNPLVIINYLNTHTIKNTKLYWLISRCLVEEAEKRSILFI